MATAAERLANNFNFGSLGREFMIVICDPWLIRSRNQIQIIKHRKEF